MSTPKQVIVVRKDLKMRKGKMAAQVAHASMSFLVDGNVMLEGNHISTTGGRLVERHLSKPQAEWLAGLFTKIVVGVNSEQELREVISKGMLAGVVVHQIEDAGLTEFHGVRTLTCAAFGPDYPDKLDSITGNLPLM